MSIHESDFVFIVRHGTCLFRHDLMGSPSSVYFLMDPAATVLLSPQYMEELIMKTMYTTALLSTITNALPFAPSHA
jgi:hypothetical protein